MQKLHLLLFSIIIGICCIFTSFDLHATETFFLPNIGCQFLIPDGYQKSDITTHNIMESMRLSLYPESMSEEEKRRRAKLEAILHKTLNEDLLPIRPFFTLQAREIGREINEKDIEVQINTFKRMKTNPVEVYENIKVDDLLNYLITKELIIDKKNNSIIMMYQSKIAGDDKDEHIIQFFKFYKTGLIIFNFYSDSNELSENINDFYTVINSFRLNKNSMPNVGRSN